MDPTISFSGSNHGSQIGINHGSITNEFHISQDLDQKLAIVPGAAFDSYENQHKDECLPGTRTDILNQIKEWAASPYREAIFWLYGIAGTGKSTISRTIAKSFSETRSLGASFFFERGEGDRGNARKLFPTIARQLAIIHPLLMPILHEAVNDNPGIAAKGLREQFDKLLFQPFKKLPLSDTSLQSVVIVIDALDECEGDGDIQLILQLLPQLQRVTTMRLQVLLTSRPDLSRFVFSKMKLDHYKDFILHNIPLEVIEHDITLFFCHRLPEIRVLHNLPTDWPGKRDLQRLITLSIPSFIFAATICRIFEELDWDPADSLSSIFTQQDDRTRLTGTYLPVLDRLLNRQNKNQKEQLVMQFRQIIGAIVVLETSLSIGALSRLLGISQRLIHLRLNPLQSVLRVPDNDITPIRLFHLSFREFLLDPVTRTKTPLGISEIETHNMLTKKCLQICQKLEENICQLPNYGSQNVEIDRQTINEYFPPELQYGCRYWAHHLVQCTELTNIAYEAYSFLQTHLLLWIEAMSLLGHALEISGIIDLLQTAIGGNAPPLILQFFHDAKRFVLKSQHIFDQAPLQVYRAGLVFLPQASIIRTIFADKHSHWISQCPLVNETWSAELQALEGHSDSVLSVAFSPDGYLLASGSKDQTVYLWDPATGTIIQILDGHSGPVNSLSFSSDSHRLATGSDDKTLRVWDLATGEELYVLEGHSNSVLSVSFSPDDRLLASGSEDQTVRLWDTARGSLKQTLDIYSSSFNSVVFSPDGEVLATGSANWVVRLWDLATSTLQKTIDGHMSLGFTLSAASESVAFSPDSQLLASCSADETVRLWDPMVSEITETLNEDDLEPPVDVMAFSPDGLFLASGSFESPVVCLWNTTTGALTHTLEGHSQPVTSVTFSPDSRILASSSADGTSRLWVLPIGTLKQTLRPQYGSVHSVAFSCDGRLLASCTDDGKVCIWDLTRGTIYQTIDCHSESAYSAIFSSDSSLLVVGTDDGILRVFDVATVELYHEVDGHSDWVNSLAFSPDNRLLASWSMDETVCLWAFDKGGLSEIWTYEITDDAYGFFQDGLYLQIGLSPLDVEMSFTNSVFPNISIEDGQWINLDGKRILWLPVDFRPKRFKVNGNKLALGHASGKVSFLQFCI